ncbi:hypothetical protein SGUI_1986 [Serinicoccus hydrothermalis]|uniref:Ribbon-helix-helix protein CopG domain-containing protein n=2 Tax=Serinicoccus hydrothermalis TaxID=1758689 RepID=A0A1B1ND72_9MICO|nr:hypothetical protein SGUI_1986 [Serinicoccus hydrothermalis]
MHIELDDDVVREVDRLAGPRERSAFVRRAVVQALDDARRAEALRQSAGSLDQAVAHAWDDDAAAWVRQTRRADERRTG